MERQILFSGKSKKKMSSMCRLLNKPRVVKVKSHEWVTVN